MHQTGENNMTPYIAPGLKDHFDIFIDFILISYGITKIELFNSSKRNCSEARFMAMYLLQEEYGISTNDAAALFSMTHSNAVHAKKTIKNLSETDKQFNKKLEDITIKIRNV